MATLALAAVGAAAGSALLPAGITLLGATLTGATIGAQIGAFAGSYVDQSLFGGSGQSRTVEGPRLKDLHVTASTEGAPVPRIYGRVRTGGQIIWASDLEESRIRHSGGGKGGLGGGGGPATIEYRYFANLAIALCEGEISGLARVWADGNELDLSNVAYRLYRGTEAQTPDSLIVASEGAGRTPAFRGVAYVVFERLDVSQFGNRIPQLSFEVVRAVEPVGTEIRGVVMIPGSGEFAYGTSPVSTLAGLGEMQAENVHTRFGGTDWTVALDQLETALPNVGSVSLVVSWFGTDLRAGHCEVKPGVEGNLKVTLPEAWRVAGVERANAYRVSRREGRPAYGGTPSDHTVVAAIRDLKARGHAVTLTPFILMDVAEDNALPSPYGGAAQPAYPWRGRITCHPAPGQPGSVDKTAAAASQIAAFVGTASPSDYALLGDGVVYTGPAEWSFRRMVLHHAFLAKAAGGVDAFVIGTELRGLTWVRSAAATYPFVSALITLAADVKTVLGGATKVTYAADWSEYFGHQPGDGSGDVHFHLDPLWASPSIDAIGIDCYWPLADWRDGASHLDRIAGARSIHDLDYLKANVTKGEGFDWYYASASDRDGQIRTPITDGSGKPWVFRYKDIRSWWMNHHYNRPGGNESASPTAWVPQSKPFWLMEVGCPAVDKGANQPNVFVDPKSSETALPYYSRGVRDDLMQRRYIKALIEAFDPAAEDYVSGTNPVSTVTGQRMVDLDRIHVYAWDARPFPAFPYNTDVWGDGENWRLGHWLNGRGAGGSLSATVAAILDDCGFATYDVDALDGVVPGYAVDRIMAARDALQPLELAYFFDSVESDGQITFRPRAGAGAVLDLEHDDLVERRPGDALITITRGQETELPVSAKISHISSVGDYPSAVAEARRLTGGSNRVASAQLPIVLDPEQAGGIAEAWLFDTWASRERAAFALPPSALSLEPGDVVSCQSPVGPRLMRITDIADGGPREIEARSIDPEVFEATATRARPARPAQAVLVGQPLVEYLDLPLLRGDEPPAAGYIAALQRPWPGAVAVYSSPQPSDYAFRAFVSSPAIMGTTLDALPAGPEGRIDHADRLTVSITGGELETVTRLQLLAGRNVLAVRNDAGEWEVLQFETATLVGPGTYTLSGLLRAQAGTEFAMRPSVAAGARVVLIDAALTRVELAANEVRLAQHWTAGPSTRSIGDPSFVGATHTFQGLGLKPLSPAHVRGTRSPSGDLSITWIRRTRIGGDSWEAPDAPLSEESERYEVDILDDGDVKRTIAVSQGAAVYTAPQQITDFGSLQGVVAVRVAQLSATYGRGTARAATV